MTARSEIMNGASGYEPARFGRRSKIIAAMSRFPASPQTGYEAADSRAEPSQADHHEGDLAAQARTGDPNAFDALVALYTPRIYTHVYRLLRNREEAEDVTQETFLRAYRYIYGFDASRSFRNWLYGIATNAGLDALRARKKRCQTMAFEEFYESKEPEGLDARTLGELRERLNHAVNRLPSRTAMLVHLHYYEGMTLGECAEIVDMTESAVKVGLHRARHTMREWLVEGDKQ